MKSLGMMTGNLLECDELYVHHHLGLGDHIICNGLVRILSNKVKVVNLFCKKNNLENVFFLYKDLNNINLIPIQNDSDIYKNFGINKIFRIGFEFSREIINNKSVGWDESFYIQLGIPFIERWNSFFVDRDLQREKDFSLKMNPKDEKFVIIHSTGSDNINRINYNLINKEFKIIEVNPKNTNIIFDYLHLIEMAEEIHCIDSSFLHLVDSVKSNGLLYYHKNKIIRNSNEFHTQKKKWKIV